MLLYAIYTPAEVNSFHRERIFAFASIESFVYAMAEYNYGNAVLMPIEHSFLKERGVSKATIIQWNAEEHKCVECNNPLWINDNSMRDTWNGKSYEITLVEHAKDEKVVHDVCYS